MNETEILFSNLLGYSRTDLYLKGDRPLKPQEISFITNALRKRMDGLPLAYILGKCEFMGLEFRLCPGVFIPRPETEILVEAALNMVKSLNGQTVKLLDIGTGSGCIAISLAKFLSNVKITAIDTSERVLKVARENAILNNVFDKIKFIKSDLFTSCKLLVTSYDIIVSNPPYIPTGEIKNLSAEVQWEPRIALDGGRDGLDFYRWMASGGRCLLKKGGLLVVEIGINQCAAVKNIFRDSGFFEIIDIVKDYSDIERVMVVAKS
jgi:release factor glutamine methyltransferase